MSQIDRMLAANERYAAQFDKGNLAVPPARRVTVVTCMDARIEPFGLLGIELGDAHVIRNAGGIVTEDVLRSLTLSQHLLETREIMVIHHTGCGLATTTDAEFADRIERHAGARPPFAAGAFTDLAQNVRTAVERLRACPFLVQRDAVRGFIFHVETGRLEEVGDSDG